MADKEALIQKVKSNSTYTRQEREEWISKIKAGDKKAIEAAKKLFKGSSPSEQEVGLSYVKSGNRIYKKSTAVKEVNEKAPVQQQKQQHEIKDKTSYHNVDYVEQYLEYRQKGEHVKAMQILLEHPEISYKLTTGNKYGDIAGRFGTYGASSIYTAVVHPIDTLKGMAYAALHPVETFKGMKKFAKEKPAGFAGSLAGSALLSKGVSKAASSALNKVSHVEVKATSKTIAKPVDSKVEAISLVKGEVKTKIGSVPLKKQEVKGIFYSSSYGDDALQTSKYKGITKVGNKLRMHEGTAEKHAYISYTKNNVKASSGVIDIADKQGKNTMFYAEKVVKEESLYKSKSIAKQRGGKDIMILEDTTKIIEGSSKAEKTTNNLFKPFKASGVKTKTKQVSANIAKVVEGEMLKAASSTKAKVKVPVINMPLDGQNVKVIAKEESKSKAHNELMTTGVISEVLQKTKAKQKSKVVVKEEEKQKSKSIVAEKTKIFQVSKPLSKPHKESIKPKLAAIVMPKEKEKAASKEEKIPNMLHNTMIIPKERIKIPFDFIAPKGHAKPKSFLSSVSYEAYFKKGGRIFKISDLFASEREAKRYAQSKGLKLLDVKPVKGKPTFSLLSLGGKKRKGDKNAKKKKKSKKKKPFFGI